jgi:FemAB-related protein (PEP-CTERM system-associated)
MLSSTVFIRPTTSQDQGAWNHYVCNHPGGTAYQLSGFIRAVEAAYRFKSICFVAQSRQQNQGRAQGILPLIHLHAPFTKGALVSLPYCDAGGVLADSPETEAALLAHAMAYAAQKKIPEVAIRSVKPFAGLDPNLTRHSGKVRMVRALPDDPNCLLGSLKSKVRSQVKKPMRDGLKFHMGGRRLLPLFYRIFCENMHDLGSVVHSFEWFYRILAFYGSRAHIGVVTTPAGEPAAAGMILCHPCLVSVPWASSLRRFNSLNPNMLLYWGFLSFAAANGFKMLDFGRSTPDAGTFRFKKQWGAVPVDLHWAAFDPAVFPHLAPSKKQPAGRSGMKRNLAEAVIRKLPGPVSTGLGVLTRKYISL